MLETHVIGTQKLLNIIELENKIAINASKSCVANFSKMNTISSKKIKQHTRGNKIDQQQTGDEAEKINIK